MLRLPDSWVWDSWLADDGVDYHLFFLRASRALHDPHLRHHRASIGHAKSRDLHTWELLADALVHADAPAWDDLATWTGSVVRDPAGGWRMFYTGLNIAERGRIQRIGSAVSADLHTWVRDSASPILEADPRWYGKHDSTAWHEEAWRDPYVMVDPDGDGWHMFITARARSGDPLGRGVIGHARSVDLVTWEVQAPLTTPAGFGQLEVPQSVLIDGTAFLVFSCWPDRMDDERRARWRGGGVWIAPGQSTTGPWDVEVAAALAHPSLYAARLVQARDRSWWALGFRDTEDGVFIGEIADPVPVRLVEGMLGISEPGRSADVPAVVGNEAVVVAHSRDMADGTYQVMATRELDAPPDQAWRAWSDSDHVRRWWGPTGFTCPRADLDFTVGGTTLVTMQAPAEYGGFLIHNGWTYTAIDEPSRIEYTLTFVDDQGRVLEPADAGIGDGVPRKVPHVVEFEPLPGGRTKVVVTESGYTDQDARSQSQAGLEQCLDKLQEIFARRGSS